MAICDFFKRGRERAEAAKGTAIGEAMEFRHTPVTIEQLRTRDVKAILADDYEWAWQYAKIQAQWEREAHTQAVKALSFEDVYRSVTDETSVPWWVVACLNMREQNQSFTGSLLNGDPLDKKTVRHPAGHGPWSSWEEAAVYAIKHEAKGWNRDLSKWKWDVAGTFFYLESYNGFGHRISEQVTPPHASPYIYSGTQLYQKGKRKERLNEATGKYEGYLDKEQVDKQLGCMAFLKALEMAGEKVFA